MKHRRAVLVLPLLLLATARADEPIDLRYGKSHGERAGSRTPARRTALPTRLRVEATEREVDDREALAAARWAAREIARTAGRREYFRIGFYEGQRAALDDHHLGEWFRAEGARIGWRDPEARALGAAMGRSAAEERAWPAAEDEIENEFADLAREPRYRPHASAPSYRPGGPELERPTLAGVFRDFPLEAYAPARAGAYLARWSWDGPRLARCPDYAEFHDADWNDPAAAFDLWLAGPRRSAYYRVTLRPAERARFRERFEASFARQLAARFEDELLRAYENGFDDGWAYGALIHEELDYRRGYREGYGDAAVDAARAAYLRTYPALYEQAYGALFDEWSTRPKPAIGEVRLVDGNDDGVFEPGELLLAEYELINYGGGEGTLPVRLEGSSLDAGASDDAFLPARAVARGQRVLRARISPGVPNRTRTRVALRAGELSKDVPLEVLFPLQLERGSVRSLRENLAGEVIVELSVENRSRRRLDGLVELRTAARPGFVDRRRVRELGERGRTTVSFAVDGLRPLDLIGGEVWLEFTALRDDGTKQDAFSHHLPDTARDLGNRDLLHTMVRLARDPQASPAEIATARELMLRRLREDWKVAAMGSGNPYKRDLKHGGAQTALGDLVRTSYGSWDRPEVFGGMAADVRALSGTLPGAHPFLRKSMRRLAARLP